MKYLDSGNRSPSEAVAAWIEKISPDDALELRWQSGYFSADSLTWLAPILRALQERNSVVRVLVGSNDAATSEEDLRALFEEIGLPRDTARLGVVAFSGGLYHPKALHLRLKEGRQIAYVGSANLTGSGLSALHVEAGLTVDTEDGDPSQLLNGIAQAVDDWFEKGRSGLFEVSDLGDVTELLRNGVIATRAAADAVKRRSRGGAGTNSSSSLKALSPLLPYSKWVKSTSGSGSTKGKTSKKGTTKPSTAPAGTSAPLANFPSYLLFAPGAKTPTKGAASLSGGSLPSQAAGLVLTLSKDSGRHFQGKDGTANISIPVATVNTLRFGIAAGKRPRPRAELELRMRFIEGSGQSHEVVCPPTNVAGYGFLPSETGHGDIRLVVPRPGTRRLEDLLSAKGWHFPQPGDFALLEWPQPNDAAFRLSFLDPGSSVWAASEALLQGATQTGSLVGDGACWLPKGVAPTWPTN